MMSPPRLGCRRLLKTPAGEAEKWESETMTEGSVQEPGFFGRYLQPYTDEFYLFFRLGFALLVAFHGAQKAFLL